MLTIAAVLCVLNESQSISFALCYQKAHHRNPRIFKMERQLTLTSQLLNIDTESLGANSNTIWSTSMIRSLKTFQLFAGGSSYPQVLHSCFHESPCCLSLPSLSLHVPALLLSSVDPGKWTPPSLSPVLVSVTTSSS